MLKIKVIEGKSYKVLAPNASHGLSIGFVVTAKEAVERTIASNKRAEERGYKGERWLIVETKWGRVFDRKSGDFVRETEHSEVIAVVNEDNTVEYK